jgi:hypothetical protein
MTMKAHRRIMWALSLFIFVGCAEPSLDKGTAQTPTAQTADPVLNMLHQGIVELNGSIDELRRHIADLEQIPTVSDPNIQELQGLDLAGWKLHLQQWILQRDHLRYTVSQIQRVRADAGQKIGVAGEWNGRQQEFLKTLEELSTHRQKLERKRVEVESQVVGRYFR